MLLAASYRQSSRYVPVLLVVTACGGESLFGDGEATHFRGYGAGSHTRASVGGSNASSTAATASGGATTTNDAASGGASSDSSGTNVGTSAPPKEPRVCVFDYDLTLSSHQCPEAEGNPQYFCRVNACDTYGWYPQCLALGARAAVAECVRRGAYIGIASKADVDYCWSDKVLPIVSEEQFPELTQHQPDTDAAVPVRYPAIDERSNWNCDDCAYTMDGRLGKPEGIRRVMRHYGLDPDLAADRARVIFWDDTEANVVDVQSDMPEVRAILVPSFTGNGVDGGCGITQQEIEAGWAP